MRENPALNVPFWAAEREQTLVDVSSDQPGAPHAADLLYPRISQPYSIALKGYFGHTNFGDDALLYAGVEAVQRVWTAAQLTVVGKEAPYLNHVVPGVPPVSSSSVRRSDVDLLLYCGGTQFFSFPYTVRGPLLPYLRYTFREGVRRIAEIGGRAQHRGVPLAALGVGLGPFLGSPHKEQETRRLFRQMVFVSVRDPSSYRLCKAWGVRNLHQHADLCYLPGLWNRELEQSKRSRIQRVGLIVRDWPYTQEGAAHFEALQRVAAELRRAGKMVTFILFTAEGDRVSRQGLAEKGEAIVHWNPETQNLSEFLTHLLRYDAFVTSRFHGAVFASILRRPVVCAEIEPKLGLAHELLDGGSRLWKYPFAPESCLAALRDLDANYRRAVVDLEAAVQRQRTLAELSVPALAEGIVTHLGKTMANLRR